jgi:outer membrane protein assembly factor BamE
MFSRLRFCFYVFASLLVLAGCSAMPRLGVYKIDINQGNYVTQDMVDKLKPGLSKTQVKLILGTPLIADAFHVNRWDYVYQLQKGGKLVEQHRFVVYFADDKLAKWEGEAAPPPLAYRSTTLQKDATVSDSDNSKPAAVVEEKGFFGRIWEKWGW